MKIKHYILLLVMISNCGPSLRSDPESIPPADMSAPNKDLVDIAVCEYGIESILLYIQQNEHEWGLTDDQRMKILSQEQRHDLLIAWTGLLEYFDRLEYIKQAHRDIITADGEQIIVDEFLPYYYAFLTQYRYGLQLLDLLDRNKAMHTILNESLPDLGLEEKSYKKFKLQFLSVATATEFVALNVINKQADRPDDDLFDRKIQGAVRYIYSIGRTKGIEITFANAVQIISDAAFTVWYPVQKNLALLLTRKKLWRWNRHLISRDDIADMGAQLRPGDIIVRRREWYLTNMGIPGFWTHSAMFIGTPEDRKNLLINDEITEWVHAQGIESGNYEELLEVTYPETYATSISIQEAHYPRIIEAIKEGVVFNSIENALAGDGIGVLRPRLSNKEKAIAIYRAFQFSGRPYDYNFDFLTDSSMVCSEVIFKSYEPSEGYGGIIFETINGLGRIGIMPNHLVRQFDENYGTDTQQLDFVLFYDGNEKMGKSLPSSLEQFRQSWRRPDWYVLTHKDSSSQDFEVEEIAPETRAIKSARSR